MLTRTLLLLASAAAATSTVACSSLTRPDDIKIYAEPLPASKPAAAPGAAQGVPQQGGRLAPRPPEGAARARPPSAAPANCGG